MTNGDNFHDWHVIRARQRDHDDLQNEIAGRDVGRIRRFLSAEDDSNPRAKDRRASERQAQLTALEILVATDPAYLALFDNTMDHLRTAEAATEKALAKAEAARDLAREDFQEVLDRAAMMADGTRVFRDADGNVRREDGSLVTGAGLESIAWPEGAPDYETFLERKEAMGRAQQTIEDIRAYQVNVLGNARDQLSDPDNPPSKDELQAIQQDIETQAPPAVRSELEPEAPLAPEPHQGSFAADTPKI